VAVIATGQLLPFTEEALPPPGAKSAEEAAAAAAAARQAGMESLLGIGFKSDPLQSQVKRAPALRLPPQSQLRLLPSSITICFRGYIEQ
jgi:hypothetical protein